MITHSIEKAKVMGYSAILTLGYPYHYAPYGFRGGKKYDISMPDGKFYTGLLVLPLRENALEGIHGSVEYHLIAGDFLGFRPLKICEN